MEKGSCSGQCLHQAQKLQKAAFDSVKSSLGPKQRDVDKRFDELNGVTSDDPHKRAEVLLEHALALYEAAYGPDHPVVAKTLLDLSAIYNKHGQTENALYINSWAKELLDNRPGKLEDEFFTLFGMNKPDAADAGPLPLA